jgi:hypothetical protein
MATADVDQKVRTALAIFQFNAYISPAIDNGEIAVCLPLFL